MVFTWQDNEKPSLGDNVTLHPGCALHQVIRNLSFCLTTNSWKQDISAKIITAERLSASV